MERFQRLKLTVLFLTVLGAMLFSSCGYTQAYPIPSMILPSSGATVIQTTQNPCFSWTPVNDSRFKSYVITVSLSTNFPSQRWAYDIFTSSTTNVCWNGGSGWVAKGTTLPLVPISEAMKVGVTYYWRVLATYHDGTTVVGTDVAGIPFTIARAAPSLNMPIDGATVFASSTNPCFSWSLPANPHFSFYTVTVSKTLDFPTTRWARTINSISTTSICWNNGSGWESKGTSPPPTPGPLENGTTYYWRVLATYTDGSLTGNTFPGRSFVHRLSSSSSSAVSSSRSSISSSRASSSNSSIPIVPRTTTYQYDELGRLKTVIYPSSIKNTYMYDAADNRTRKETTN